MSIPAHQLRTLSVPLFILEDNPACAETDPELFFPLEVDMGFGRFTSKYQNASAARKICASCPLIEKCLDYALLNNEVGIWGGTTEEQRKQIRKNRGRKSVRKYRTPDLW